MTSRIRRATAADIDTLFDIRTSVRQNHLSREQMAELGITPQALKEALEAGPCAWIAEVDGSARGFAMVDMASAEVYALFVRPQWEGQGLGSLLLRAAETELFREHETIWLLTDGGDEIRANGFYLKRGWERVAPVDERDVRYEKSRPADKE